MVYRTVILASAILCAGFGIWKMPPYLDSITFRQHQKQDKMLWQMSQECLRECDARYGQDAPNECLPIGAQLRRRAARNNLASLEARYPEWQGKKLE